MMRYPAYKDSGVEWIGEIPEHWGERRLKYSDKVIMGQSPSSDDYNDLNIGFPFLQGNADFTSLYPNPRIWCDTARKYAEKNDVLLSVRAPIGAVNIADQKYGIGRGLCAIRSVQSLPALLFYFALSLNSELNRIGTGSTYTAISVDDVKNIFIPTIPLPEQKLVTDYLDRRTRQIDTLIEKKQKQIDLLKEQRTAIINQAVTKGLNPDVKMKDSGIEWLGEIPDHWGIKRLKHVTKINPTKSNCQIENGSNEIVTFLPMEKVNSDGSYNTELKRPIKELWSGFTYFEKGDTIVAKITPCFENGKGAFLDNLGSKIGFGSTEFHVLRGTENVSYPKYIYYITRSDLFRKTGKALMFGAAGQKRVPVDFVEDFIMGLPPFPEQKLITDYLDRKTREIGTLIGEMEQQINLLQECRTALISEAVTGKIDVRGEVLS